MEESISIELIIIILFCIAYLILISIIGDKYNELIKLQLQNNYFFSAKEISEEKFTTTNLLLKNKIAKLKQKGYLSILILMIINYLVLLINMNLIYYFFNQPLITAAIFSAFLSIIFWLKGSGTIDNQPRFPGGGLR